MEKTIGQEVAMLGWDDGTKTEERKKMTDPEAGVGPLNETLEFVETSFVLRRRVEEVVIDLSDMRRG